MDLSAKPVARHSDLVIQQLADELLVYDLRTHKAHCLNDSAAAVWKLCDGTRSFTEITKTFAADRGNISDNFIWLAIDQLNGSQLLDNAAPPHFTSTSRRQVLKSIGMATAVALPVIASLVSPKSALANVNCACTAPATCAQMIGCPSTTNCSTVSGTCSPI